MDVVVDGPTSSDTTILLAHGAGAPMDSRGMQAIAGALAQSGARVVRFEFGYMAARRSGRGRPPPKAELLVPEFRAAVDALGEAGRLVIGGKSMGGRVASMLADDLFRTGRIAGLLCIGYPFHPADRPLQTRTAHLEHLLTPALIVQGTRDPFGTPDEVTGYSLSPAIEIAWLADGDHDLKPRKSVSGFTAADHLAALGERVEAWLARLDTPAPKESER